MTRRQGVRCRRSTRNEPKSTFQCCNLSSLPWRLCSLSLSNPCSLCHSSLDLPWVADQELRSRRSYIHSEWRAGDSCRALGLEMVLERTSMMISGEGSPNQVWETWEISAVSPFPMGGTQKELNHSSLWSNAMKRFANL